MVDPEEDYKIIQTRSWKEPVEQVNFCIASDRKKHVVSHTRATCQYYNKTLKIVCPYCNKGIPITEDLPKDSESL